MRKWFSLVVAVFWLAGCAAQPMRPPVPAMIVIKTPALRYADQGFVSRSQNRVKLQVYVSGQPAFEMTIGRRICILKEGCMSEKAFYRRFMGVSYPRGTLAAIVNHRPIFGGEGLEKAGDFTRQRIQTDRFDIIYAFDSESVRFKDRKHHILITIKTL